VPGPPDLVAGGWGDRGIERLAVELVPERDWLEPYRAASQPFALGRRFLVDPGDPRDDLPPAPGGRRLLRLPAGRAFGTGSHESTRLAALLLEASEVAGRRVLDVGTGTGILAFAALALGAREVVALDVDPLAAFTARGNVRLNRGQLGRGRLYLFAGAPAALLAPGRFDLALANVVPSEIRGSLSLLAACLASAGELILSGLLAEQEGEVLSELGGLGLGPRETRRDGEWLALRLRRVAHAPDGAGGPPAARS
jgi:ribosomal protein L11 methyltransferase